MDEKQLQALANELAKNLKTPEDLSQFDRLLKKLSVEAALNAEMTHHPGYEKNQTRITGMDNQILSLYAKGMTTREIAAAFKELYDADVSLALISKVTDAVMEQVVEWQNRPLDAVYPIVYLDCIVLKVRQDSRVINKSVFLALGINIEGQKELLGMWLAENEGAKFWLNVLTELKNRGLNDILIACVDGLKDFPDAINTVYPKARIQLCIVHMVRNSLRFVSWKDYKAVTRDLKAIYQAPTEEAGQQALEAFAAAWDCRYPQISRSWQANWPNPDLDTLTELEQQIDAMRNLNPELKVYCLQSMATTNPVLRGNERKEFLEYLEEFPTIQVLDSVICFRKVYRDCMSNGTGVVETNNTAAKAEIEHLMNEVFGPW
ncbi:IS256 family transposase [Escherichia marmotae]